MRGLRHSTWLVAAILAASACAAQEPDTPGPLVIWVVKPAPPPTIPAIYKRYNEQTVGSFGQSAGDAGTASSNVGETASSLPSRVSSTESSNYGQTSSSLPSRVSSTESSNVGQTAASFGGTTTGAGRAAANAALDARRAADPLSDPAMSGVARYLHTPYGKTVTADKLADKLREAEGTEQYPDLLVGLPLPSEVAELPRDSYIVMHGEQENLDVGDLTPREDGSASAWRRVQVVMMTRARHPGGARRYFVGLSEMTGSAARAFSMDDIPDSWKPVWEPLYSFATNVTERLMGAASLGSDADPEMVNFDPALARSLALGRTPGEPVESLIFDTEVLALACNAHLATATLRVTVEGTGAFWVLHPTLVFRKDANGRWKVLQVMLNLAPPLSQAIRNGLGQTAEFEFESIHWMAIYPQVFRDQLEFLTTGKVRHAGQLITPVVTHAKGISQAAPEDGDSRPLTPDLWWDNRGPQLLVVEWQREYGDAWDDSRMYFVMDKDPKLQTRVPARFADKPGWYRWRVWSVGSDFSPELGSWRRLLIQ